MGTYSRLLKIYRDYIKKDVVEENNEVISAYTLWNLVKEEIARFQYHKNENYELLDFINYIYKNEYKATWYSGVDFYDRATENFDVKIPTFKPIKFIGIESNYINDKKTLVIDFILSTKVTDNKERVNEKVRVYRDFDDDSYYGNHINNYLVSNCEEYLDDTFSAMKFFAPIISEYGEVPTTQFIDNGIMSITINHSPIGEPSLVVKLSSSVDANDSQYKKYSNETYTVNSLMQGMKDDILKHTPVKVNDLNTFCKAIVKSYLNDKNASNSIGVTIRRRYFEEEEQVQKVKR